MPDSPFYCDLLNVSSSAALIACLPGFTGGEPNTYPVYTSTDKKLPSREETNSEKVSNIKSLTLANQGTLPYIVCSTGQFMLSRKHILAHGWKAWSGQALIGLRLLSMCFRGVLKFNNKKALLYFD